MKLRSDGDRGTSRDQKPLQAKQGQAEDRKGPNAEFRNNEPAETTIGKCREERGCSKEET